MKKLFFTAMLALTTILSIAQSSNNKLSAEVKRQIEILKLADLNLTDIQIGRITTVLVGEEEIATKMSKALEGNKSLLHTRMTQLKANKINNIKGGMNSVQAEKFDALNLAEKF